MASQPRNRDGSGSEQKSGNDSGELLRKHSAQSNIFSLMEKAKEPENAKGRFDRPFLGEIEIKGGSVAFVGDTHGNAGMTKRILDMYYVRSALMVFLGDYV